jgi:DNA-binding response OmpR family regulator
VSPKILEAKIAQLIQAPAIFETKHLRRGSIPVVVLTTSEADVDILNCYKLGASCYITKPFGFEAFLKVVHALEDFWFTVVKMPPKE